MKRLTAPQIALIVAIVTLGSKFIGFVREIIKANYYGTSYVVDSLGIAESIPNMIFVGLLAATATSFIPLFSEKIEREGEVSANLYTSRVINTLLIICTISTAIGIIFSEQMVTFFTMPEQSAPAGSDLPANIAWFVTHGWTGEKAQLAATYVNITFSYCLFTSVSGIIESYLRYKNVFVRPVLSGYIISFMMVVAIIFSHAISDPRYIVAGSLVGNAIRIVILLMLSKRNGYKYTPSFRVNKVVGKIFTLALPFFIATSAWQISIFVDNIIASSLDTGNIASLQYSSLLTNMVVAVTTNVIAAIIYPRLSQAHTLGDRERFADLFTNGITISFIIGIPVTLAAMIYHYHIVQIVFERGIFTPESTALTARALLFLAPSMLFAMGSGIVMHVLFSMKEMKVSMFTGFAAISVNIAFDILLIKSMGNAGLTLATSLSQMTNMILLMLLIRRKVPGIITRGFLGKCVQIAFASIIAVCGTAPLFFGLRSLFAENGWIMPRMVLLGITALAAIAIYVAILRRMKIRELQYFREMLGQIGRKRRGAN